MNRGRIRLYRQTRVCPCLAPLPAVPPLPSRDMCLRISLQIALLLLGTLSSFAAGERSRARFDIPAGEAIVTLKQAAQQAGLEIAYPPALVRGVTTRAVFGDFTPLEALEKMVANTPLKIFRDRRSGMFSVMQRSDSELRTPPHQEPPTDPPRSMNRKNPFTILSGWLAFALAPAPA